MEELKVIENELIPVYETSTGEKVVYGSELHDVLEVKSNYREWAKRRLSDCEATENEDYDRVEISTVVGGTPKAEYIIKLDTAKEMAMLERNDKGKEVRRYFIKVEKKYKQSEQQKNVNVGTDKTKAMMLNAKARVANTYLKLANVDTLSKEYKNILVAKASEILSGEQLLPLPKTVKKTYSAKEIGDILGISACKVGRIANAHNLKADQYGEYYHDKSQHSNREVDTFRYFENAVDEFRKYL